MTGSGTTGDGGPGDDRKMWLTLFTMMPVPVGESSGYRRPGLTLRGGDERGIGSGVRLCDRCRSLNAVPMMWGFPLLEYLKRVLVLKMGGYFFFSFLPTSLIRLIPPFCVEVS